MADIGVPDGTTEGFRILLRSDTRLVKRRAYATEKFSYIYTDAARLTVYNVGSVLYLSKKYLVAKLYERAIAFVNQQVNATNVLEYLPVAEIFEELQDKYIMI